MHWIDTFIIDFPMKVAPKNILKGIRKCPQVRPAKSNKGLGIEENKTTTIKAWFLRFLYSHAFALSIRGNFVLLSKFSTSLNSSNSSCLLPAILAALATK